MTKKKDGPKFHIIRIPADVNETYIKRHAKTNRSKTGEIVHALKEYDRQNPIPDEQDSDQPQKAGGE